jgi:hypothetical protein
MQHRVPPRPKNSRVGRRTVLGRLTPTDEPAQSCQDGEAELSSTSHFLGDAIIRNQAACFSSSASRLITEVASSVRV